MNDVFMNSLGIGGDILYWICTGIGISNVHYYMITGLSRSYYGIDNYEDFHK